MKDSRSDPLSWKLVILSVLPGLILTLQNYGMYRVLPRSTPYWALPLCVVFYTIFAITVSFIQKRKLELWIFPALGSSIFEMWWLYYIWDTQEEPIVVNLFLLAFTLCALIVLFRFRKMVSKIGIILFVIVPTAIILLGLLNTSKGTDFSLVIITSILYWMIHFIPILTLGLFFVYEYGLSATLLVATCEPFMIKRYLGIDLSYGTLTSPVKEIQIAQIVSNVIPILVFLVIAPIFVLRSSSRSRQAWILALMSFVVIAIVSYLRVIYLQGPSNPIYVPLWALWMYYLLVLWSPTLLAILIYRNLRIMDQ
jgi:hypothetical protein